ncbi:MAG: sulfite exporter TauE/SafE family protein [Inquilinus sp.]|nr:sulfite exporter TauE/SafE family protein [Inquilinus sp.]
MTGIVSDIGAPFDLLPNLAAWQIAALVAAFLVGGIVKGTIGFGLPLVTIALMANVVPPKEAIGISVLPTLASNLLLVLEARRPAATIRRHLAILLLLPVGVAAGALSIRAIDGQALMLGLGIVIMVFVALDTVRIRLTVTAAHERLSGAIAGFVAGLFGGLTGVFAPPMVLHLLGLNLDRMAYVSAVGILWTAAAASITVAFGAVDLLTVPLAIVAVALIVPMAAGMGIGRLIRLRLNPVWFRRAIAAGLFAAALRLVVTGLA